MKFGNEFTRGGKTCISLDEVWVGKKLLFLCLGEMKPVCGICSVCGRGRMENLIVQGASTKVSYGELSSLGDLGHNKTRTESRMSWSCM
ncbi:hypothetical protein RHMOL_Rhmol09G0201900 [Rhododendron molle]|uniref:Uncharacterized protein n=1 Tax=Rhododendron molle TaxID=49168 RepID=A0ACC0MGJ3_RHOML|nr:hypothetical protein RHMOL_Rhmol09G0201900 [Rhododendron molle]